MFAAQAIDDSISMGEWREALRIAADKSRNMHVDETCKVATNAGNLRISLARLPTVFGFSDPDILWCDEESLIQIIRALCTMIKRELEPYNGRVYDIARERLDQIQEDIGDILVGKIESPLLKRMIPLCKEAAFGIIKTAQQEGWKYTPSLAAEHDQGQTDARRKVKRSRTESGLDRL